jgi:predicted RND superfamily exporter protein
MFNRRFGRNGSMAAPLITFGIGKIVGIAIGAAVAVMFRDKIMGLGDKYQKMKVNRMIDTGIERAHYDSNEAEPDYITVNNDATLTEKIGDVLQ